MHLHVTEGLVLATPFVAITVENADLVPIVVALIAGVVPLTGIVLSHRRAGKKIEQIHVLVNSRLDEALHEIAALKEGLDRKDAVIKEQARVASELATAAREISAPPS